jgi:hypothetical protein
MMESGSEAGESQGHLGSRRPRWLESQTRPRLRLLDDSCAGIGKEPSLAEINVLRALPRRLRRLSIVPGGRGVKAKTPSIS